MPLEARASGSTALAVRRKRREKPKAPTWYRPLEDQDQSPSPVHLPTIRQLLDAPTTTIGRQHNSSPSLAPRSAGPSVRSRYSFPQPPVPLPSRYEPEEGSLVPVDTGLVVAPLSPGPSVRSRYSFAQPPIPLPSRYEPEEGGLVPVDAGLVVAPLSPGPSVRSRYSFAQPPVPLPSHYEPEEGRVAPVDTGLVAAPPSPTISISRPPPCEQSESQNHSIVAPADSGLVRYPQQSRSYRSNRDESDDDGGNGEDASAPGDDVQVDDDDMQVGDDDDMEVGVSGDPDALIDNVYHTAFSGGLDDDDQDDAYNEHHHYTSNEADESNNRSGRIRNSKLKGISVSYKVPSPPKSLANCCNA